MVPSRFSHFRMQGPRSELRALKHPQRHCRIGRSATRVWLVALNERAAETLYSCPQTKAGLYHLPAFFARV
jgi:hypothetical protein